MRAASVIARLWTNSNKTRLGRIVGDIVRRREKMTDSGIWMLNARKQQSTFTEGSCVQVVPGGIKSIASTRILKHIVVFCEIAGSHAPLLFSPEDIR